MPRKTKHIREVEFISKQLLKDIVEEEIMHFVDSIWRHIPDKGRVKLLHAIRNQDYYGFEENYIGVTGAEIAASVYAPNHLASTKTRSEH